MGIGAEVAAEIMEQAFDWLDAPVTRVGMRDIPMPYNDALERSAIQASKKSWLLLKQSSTDGETKLRRSSDILSPG